MGDAVGIDIWGPNLWGAMHSLSFTYPADCESGCEHRKAFHSFLKSLKTLLPCAKCKNHYTTWFNKNITRGEQSEIFDSRENLSRALIDLHNDVDKRLNKTQLSFDEAKQKYMRSSVSCKLDNLTKSMRSSTLIIWIILALILSATAIFVGISFYGNNISKRRRLR